jgi:hypothetical protein
VLSPNPLFFRVFRGKKFFFLCHHFASSSFCQTLPPICEDAPGTAARIACHEVLKDSGKSVKIRIIRGKISRFAFPPLRMIFGW